MEPLIAGHHVYWLELRPGENGRNVVVRRAINGETRDIVPFPFNARTRVHEYGGAAYIVDNETVFFSNLADQRIYCQGAEGEFRPLTPEGPYRYADAVMDGDRGRLICVREDHSDQHREPINTIVGVPVKGRCIMDGAVLVEGADFYSSPRLSPDGSKLAWISWCHPNMPWDSSKLWVAELDSDGIPIQRRVIADGDGASVLQPEWSPHGTLYFISDQSGWWNLYRWRDDLIECVIEMSAEFGCPPWRFGDSTYAFVSEGCIICAYTSNGVDYLASIDTTTDSIEQIQTSYTSISYVRAAPGRVVFLGGSPTEFFSIVELDVKTRQLSVLRRSSKIQIDPGYLSIPEAIEFPTENGITAYAFFYPPKNRDYIGPSGERPPLLVISHGGPTTSSNSTLKLGIQYWTSRGIAVVDVNYGGSSGYGRAYRWRLNGQWGVVDVNDCVNSALYLTKRGRVDKDRLAIRGASAGGYTSLSALAFRNVFKAGTSQFGVSDLEALARDTHKFESHYLDGLVGAYPKYRDLYRQRSPINAVDSFSCPTIFFQGLEDKVVPPSQTEKIVEALRAGGLPVAYLAFEGEQHGFRSAATIKRVLDAELYFYSCVFGFDLPDPVEPLEIDNKHKLGCSSAFLGHDRP